MNLNCTHSYVPKFTSNNVLFEYLNFYSVMESLNTDEFVKSDILTGFSTKEKHIQVQKDNSVQL